MLNQSLIEPSRGGCMCESSHSGRWIMRRGVRGCWSWRARGVAKGRSARSRRARGCVAGPHAWPRGRSCVGRSEGRNAIRSTRGVVCGFTSRVDSDDRIVRVCWGEPGRCDLEISTNERASDQRCPASERAIRSRAEQVNERQEELVKPVEKYTVKCLVIH